MNENSSGQVRPVLGGAQMGPCIEGKPKNKLTFPTGICSIWRFNFEKLLFLRGGRPSLSFTLVTAHGI